MDWLLTIKVCGTFSLSNTIILMLGFKPVSVHIRNCIYSPCSFHMSLLDENVRAVGYVKWWGIMRGLTLRGKHCVSVNQNTHPVSYTQSSCCCLSVFWVNVLYTYILGVYRERFTEISQILWSFFVICCHLHTIKLCSDLFTLCSYIYIDSYILSKEVCVFSAFYFLYRVT